MSVACHLQVPELEEPSFSFLRGDAPWLDAVKAILGSPS